MRQLADDLYRQVTLERVSVNGTLKEVSYIPDKYAVVGRNVEFKTDEKWDGYVWKVIAVSDTYESGKTIQRKSHNAWQVGGL